MFEVAVVITNQNVTVLLSVISWQSVLLVDETRVPGENL